MTLVIALALLIAFTWYVSHRDESQEPGWATQADRGAERIAPRRSDGDSR